MDRIKSMVLSIILAVIVYLTAFTGLMVVTERQSSASSGGNSAVVTVVEEPRPVAPERDITQQRLSAQEVGPDGVPFWNR